MNFSVWQWRVVVVLDVLLKAFIMYLSAVFATLGMVIMSGFELLVPFILVAASLSALHFLCLFFGSRLVAWLEPTHRWPRALKFALVLIFTNIVFALSFTVLRSANGDVYNEAMLSLLVVVTNLVPILLTAAIGRISGLIWRPR